MKANRFLVIFSLLMVFSVTAVTGWAASQNQYPDLLSEDWSEIDTVEESTKIIISDPLEPVNRFFFQFNDVFYEWLLKPVADGYSWILPQEIRECFGNFFLNIAMPVRFLNSVLQGDLEKSGMVLKRFLINSTLGVYGFADVAAEEFEFDRERADFGQTLGKWGMGEGIYLCWPIVGPSSIRGSVGRIVDTYTHPVPYFHDSWYLDSLYYAGVRVNNLSLNPDVYEDLKKYSLDPYVASRQAYYEYRRALID